MVEVADAWAASDEQPTHPPPQSSLHQKTTGTQRVNLSIVPYCISVLQSKLLN